MKTTLAILSILSCLSGICQAELTLVDGPPRSFGGRTVVRTFHLDIEGPAEFEWRTRFLRGIVERGIVQAVGPEDVVVELNLPAVRARIELIQEVQVKQAGKVVAAGEFPMELFPEGLAAPADTPAPVIGVIEEQGATATAGKLAAFLEKAGWQVVPLVTNLQYRQVESKLVLVGPNQPESLAEPMNGLDDFVQGGGTVIFLEQNESRKNLFDPQRRWELTPSDAILAEPLMKGDHSALLDLKQGDLANWDGTDHVATHVLTWNDWPWQRIWLASPPPDAQPLVVEYWNGPSAGSGRVILCQCEIDERLEAEPVAQLLLRNLIYFAFLRPSPPPVGIVRFALQRGGVGKDGLPLTVRDPNPEELKNALASAIMLVPEDMTKAADGNFIEMLAAGLPTVIQSEFDEEMIGVLNRLMAALPPLERQKPPEFIGQTIPKEAPTEIDYRHNLLWGLNAQTFTRAIAGAEDLRAPAPAGDIPGFNRLTAPAILSQFEGGRVQIVFCALPLDDPENKDRNRLMNQILSNLADPPKKVRELNVK